MSSRLRFFGVAAYQLVNPLGQHILLDPFLDQNPRARLDRINWTELI